MRQAWNKWCPTHSPAVEAIVDFAPVCAAIVEGTTGPLSCATAGGGARRWRLSSDHGMIALEREAPFVDSPSGAASDGRVGSVLGGQQILKPRHPLCLHPLALPPAPRAPPW